jgi:hypothetical protein
LCRPFPDARNFTQPAEESVHFQDPFKIDLAFAHRKGERPNGLGPRFGQADGGKIGTNKRLGSGE